MMRTNLLKVTTEVSGFDLLGGAIKSIQRITTNIGNTRSGTISIGAVDITSSIVRQTSVPAGSMNYSGITLNLINATTIEWQRLDTGNAPTITIEVIEFGKAKSLQRVDISIPTNESTTTTNISAINTDKAIIFYSVRGNTSLDAVSVYKYNMNFQNNNTLTASRVGALNYTATFNIQIIEFN